MKVMDYRQVLNLSVDGTIKSERFYAKMHNFFINSSSVEFDEIYEQTFCDAIGVEMKLPDEDFGELLHEPTGLARVWIYMEKCKSDFYELLFRCVTLINTLPKSQKKLRDWLYYLVVEALEDCQIQHEILNDKDGVFIIPKGAKELDNALVSQPLEWLNEYPNARKAWIKALKDYADEADEKASDIADKFRKALEAFFQEFFGGNKSLENYKTQYGSYLKENGVPKEVSANFETLFQTYTNYMNNYAKHRDAVSDNVLEYIMYQSGNIIRLLITLKQGATNNAD